MPLHGKIVVIKRSGVDGTEFPLTSSCLFGRKPDCDIRIQLPQVSKEHCRIDMNENKEVILTNLSSVNPTRVNGEVLQQSERLKHGDVITIIDRSFRFEYPPPPTPKKRSSTGGKTETLKVLKDQQVVDTVTDETDPHLKDGSNHDNIQRSLDKTVEVDSKETTSPFSDLYQMIKKSLDVKTPRKSCASLLQTPTSRFCTPKPGSVRKSVISTEDKSTPKKDEVKAFPGGDETNGEMKSTGKGTPKSVEKQRKSFQVPLAERAETTAEDVEQAIKSDTASLQKRNRTTPQRLTAFDVIKCISAETPKSPARRRSKEATPAKPAVTDEQEQETTAAKIMHLKKASPSNSGKADKVNQMSKKRKSGELAADLPTPLMKKKRVSFGGYLSPEVFDKRLPPDSPLRKGATPRRSLCLPKPKQSLLRRASSIGIPEDLSPKLRKSSGAKNASLGKKSPKSRSPSPKAASPSKKSPKSKTASPKAASHANKSSKSKAASPKAASPSKKSPKSKTASPKAASPANKSPKSKVASPKAASPANKSPKSKTASPKAASPANKSPKSKVASPKAASPANKSPKSKTASPKAASPANKSPKSKAASPKAASPANKSPKSKTASPKAASPANKSPKSKAASPKAASPANKSPKSKTPSPRSPSLAKKSPKSKDNEQPKTPLTSRIQTPTVQGRFSVSHISTPSPVADDVIDQASVSITPKIPMRRKSMKTTSQKTPSMLKSAMKVMRRKSGISRASMKVLNSWADIVKFGKTKAQVVAPVKEMVAKKTKKKVISKPQTPARKLKGHVSTGHADSPVTIVVGRAHKQKAHLTGAAPRVVTNTALFKKNMEMDEDLTGISEMFKTPVKEKKSSMFDDSDTTKTPMGDLSMSVVEPSVLNTPQEPGEMMVSPLSVVSTVELSQYNSEAVKRLLNGDQDSSFICDDPALQSESESSAQQCTDLKTGSVTPPKQEPDLPDCLTGVKRMMKTLRQKAEPADDIRGKLLKTPKQKPEQQDCLTGVKRIMKTPRQKAEAIEDIRGRLLKTPKQKPEHQECLTGVKRIMKTPRQKAEPIEDIRGRLLKTPKQKPEQQECLTGVKRLMKTPREKSEPVEYNFGIRRLMKSPRLRGTSPVEDFEGLSQLLEEPTGHIETNEVEDQSHLDCGVDVAKGDDQEPLDSVPSDVTVAQVDTVKGFKADANKVVKEELTSGPDSESSDAMEAICHTDVVPKVGASDDNLSEEQTEVETTTDSNRQMVTPATNPDHEKKSVRGRRAKTVGTKIAEDKQEAAEVPQEPIIPAPVRGRKGKKTETTAPPAVRQTRNRNPNTTGSRSVEISVDERATQSSNVALKPKRGRNAKKASDDQPEMVQEIVTETESSSTDGDQKSNDSAAPMEKAVSKPRRGKKTKQEAERSQSVTEQQNVPCTHSDDVRQADNAKGAIEICSDHLEMVPKGNDKNKSSDSMETVPKAPATECALEVETATCNVTETDVAIALKKPVRGRRAKMVGAKAAENKEAQEPSEDAVVTAPVRGRRGKKTDAHTPPAVKQTRSRNAKSLDATSDGQPEIVPEKTAEATLVSAISIKAVSNQKPPIKTSQEENSSALPAEEAVVKPVKGRKTKQARIELPQPEPERNEVVSDRHQEAQPQQPINSAGTPRRGRKRKPDTAKQHELSEETVIVETKQQPQPPVRDKRGRNAKQETNKLENDSKATTVETVTPEEPVKKLRRTRKAEQTVEIVVPEEAEDHLVAKPVKKDEQVVVPAKPRRGRKAKQDTDSETPVESTEVEEAPAVSSTDKPKRARRGVTRGAAADDIGQTNPSQDLSSAAAEVAKTSKRSIRWKADLEVFELPKVTPVRAGRGRKSKLEDHIEAESKNELKDANKTEEKDLSGKGDAQPAKRARRGAKAIDEAESSGKVDPKKGAEAQPKTRRGRAAKK
ncbi:proliferation marker protein Ki-67 isoform X2 [Mastacembelus armatus]|uniref:proliferation marker protein Ki-67 isoform X2 n=1 Tax=Mastacembelus armatus TaxID=205130 RepID=UPI000E45E35B|nr:proliferation marker protein Ki-67-like isoform X2 [Mastacembelus armatus]